MQKHNTLFLLWILFISMVLFPNNTHFTLFGKTVTGHISHDYTDSLDWKHLKRVYTRLCHIKYETVTAIQ